MLHRARTSTIHPTFWGKDDSNKDVETDDLDAFEVRNLLLENPARRKELNKECTVARRTLTLVSLRPFLTRTAMKVKTLSRSDKGEKEEEEEEEEEDDDDDRL